VTVTTPVPAAPLTETAVVLRDVRKTYHEGRAATVALRGISLSLPTGSTTAIIGQSGSGKSTLLNCAAGLDRPTSGAVVVGGYDISASTTTT
jgi:putative ABC transport system ATP-binding protein